MSTDYKVRVVHLMIVQPIIDLVECPFLSSGHAWVNIGASHSLQGSEDSVPFSSV